MGSVHHTSINSLVIHTHRKAAQDFKKINYRSTVDVKFVPKISQLSSMIIAC